MKKLRKKKKQELGESTKITHANKNEPYPPKYVNSHLLVSAEFVGK